MMRRSSLFLLARKWSFSVPITSGSLLADSLTKQGIPCLADNVWVQLTSEWMRQFGKAVKESVRWSVGDDFTLLEPLNLIPIGLVIFGCLTAWRKRPPINHPHVARRLICLSILSSVVFLVLLHIAMAIYPGGTIIDANSSGYSLTNNFLSDLGRDYPLGTTDGPNTAIFFGVALTLASVVLVSQSWILPWKFATSGPRWIAVLASSLACLSAWFIFRTAWCPFDWHVEAHQSFAMLGLLALGASSFLLLVALMLQGAASRIQVIALIGSCVCIAGYLLLKMVDDDRVFLGTTWLSRQATAQKLVLYSAVISASIQLKIASASCRESSQSTSI